MPESRIKVDERLVERAKSGDAEAFGQLHDRYAESVFRFLYARLNNRMDAEDLFGEVFLRTWNSLPRYKSQGLPFSAYLFRIARNLLIDHYRKSNSEKHIDTQDIKASEVLQVSPYERLVTKQEIEELKDTLSLLRRITAMFWLCVSSVAYLLRKLPKPWGDPRERCGYFSIVP